MLNYAEGSIQTARGKFSVKYERKGEKVDAVINVESEETVNFMANEKLYAIKNGENKITF